MKKSKIFSIYLVSIIVLIILILYSAKTGSIEMTFPKLIKGLFVKYDSDVATIYDLRFPRIIIAIIAGAAISISGVLLQAVMQNPLVDPGIIGISSAASLSASIAMIISPSLYYLSPLFSVLGGLVAYLLIYSIAWNGGSNPIKLILVGVALNMTLVGINEAIKSMMGGNLTNVQSIIEGNVSQKTWADVKIMAVYGIIFLIISLFTIRTANLLQLEDQTAKSLGVNVNRDRFMLALVAVVLASVSTAVVGVIGFLGLVVPHISRIIIGSNHKNLIPYSMILGAITLLLSDTCGRVIAYPHEIKPSVVMSVVGGIFFIILLKIEGKDYGN
ncbi:FecCD family ABC transporter permease [Peptoniphilus rhinitidis]|uniref:FecCD family ABC transporter permease n=1 Tax=Peptoniphilus rhinitidis TaxID=1175452 RepID=UPI002355AE26|nr:iron ABC transporter permease [Peptoniphilus rhinitidis]